MAHRMMTKTGLRRGFGSWQQHTAEIIARNLKTHKVSSVMLRMRYALFFRFWNVAAVGLARQHRVCLRALAMMSRKMQLESFRWWASVVEHTDKESRRYGG